MRPKQRAKPYGSEKVKALWLSTDPVGGKLWSRLIFVNSVANHMWESTRIPMKAVDIPPWPLTDR